MERRAEWLVAVELLLGTSWNRLRRAGEPVSGTEERERRSGVNFSGAAASAWEGKDDGWVGAGGEAWRLPFWRTS